MKAQLTDETKVRLINEIVRFFFFSLWDEGSAGRCAQHEAPLSHKVFCFL